MPLLPRLALASCWLIATLLLVARPAGADTITFDEPLQSLAHGEIVDADFPGVAISAINPHRGFDLAIAFDTTVLSSADPDLQFPFIAGNAAGATLGNVLILAENDSGCGDDLCDEPDDEGRSSAAFMGFVLAFDADLTAFSLTMLDIEAGQANGASLAFFRDGLPVGQVFLSEFACASGSFCDPSVDFAGDRSANRLPAVTAAALGGAFDEVRIDLHGSGAVDALSFTVPEPALCGLLAPALLLALGAGGRLSRPRPARSLG